MILKHFVSEGMKNSPRNIYWWSQEEKERIEFEIDRSLIFFFFREKYFVQTFERSEETKTKYLKRGIFESCKEKLWKINKNRTAYFEDHWFTPMHLELCRGKWKENKKKKMEGEKKKEKGINLSNSSSV